jgi:hypothetical protein
MHMSSHKAPNKKRERERERDRERLKALFAVRGATKFDPNPMKKNKKYRKR